MKLQYETWSLSKIIGVNDIGPIETDGFSNVKFKVARGSASQCYEFTLADLPCINPNEWLVLYNMLLKEKRKIRTYHVLSPDNDQVLHSGDWRNEC